MGKVVLNIKKPKGNDARTTAHIERTVMPGNADPTRTHLNRELIDYPDEVENRTQAIQQRIETAGIKRKITDNQIRALQVLLSGSPEDMQRIQAEGRLDEWCKDSVEWLQEEFGKENVVSAVLHVDETTPHIHATVVPIVQGQRRKAQTEENNGKKKYRKKAKDTVRLCADDVMTRTNLEKFQDTYAEKMNRYGLERGVRGSEARNISTIEFYKDIYQKSMDLQQNVGLLSAIEDARLLNIEQLRRQEQETKQYCEQAENRKQQKTAELKETEEVLNKTKAELKTEKLKNTAADIGSNIMDGIGSLVGTSKVKRQQQEIENLKTDKDNFTEKITGLKQYIHTLQQEHKTITDKLKEELKKIHDLFPKLKELLRIETLCKHLGFGEELTKKILDMKPVGFKGKLYSAEYKRKFETEHSVAEIKSHPTEKDRLQLTIDNLSDTNWFRQKYKEFQQSIGIKINEPKKQQRQKW